MKEVLKKNAGILFIVVFIFLLLLGKDKREELAINKNKESAIAKITSIKKGKGSHVNYVFRYKDKWFSDTDSWNGKAAVNEYFKVEFDKTNPANSAILLRNKSINPMRLVNQGVEIKASVNKVAYPSKAYIDLYISYTYNNEEFSFRTRKHIDSLPCGVVTNCLNATIPLKINDKFPALNNLYYESYDRSRLREKLKLKTE